jgi:Rrf2 family protein
MVDLAAQHSDDPVMLRKISERQDLSKKYLDNIFTSLRLAGLLRTVRGASGGYLLARDPAQITVAEVVKALEGSVSPVDCINHPELCERSHDCAARQLWSELERAMFRVLENRTLKDLVERHEELMCLAGDDGSDDTDKGDDS